VTESESYRRRRELLDQVDAEMLAIHERVMDLTRKGLPADEFDVRMQVSMRLEQLTEAVDAALGYFERSRADGDRVVLVDRSRAEPVELTYPIADWRVAGPRILAAALERWAVEGGRVQISGSWGSGRGHAVTDIPAGRQAAYEAFAWYTPDGQKPPP
jgi:hypothetical protein